MNDGVLLGKRDSDFIAGVLPYEERNPSGNWDAFLPPGEWQRVNGQETMACVTFSALNSIETTLNYMLYMGMLSDAQIQTAIALGYIRKK